MAVNSRGASVCIVIAPITSPSRPETGTDRSDWNFSSSSSGTNLLRGSSTAFCVKAGSPCSTAHQAMPSPFSSAIDPARLAYGADAALSTRWSFSIR